jgi:type II secretion system protein G
MRRQSGGFTILEVLIVVGILGILAAIAIANYLNAAERTRQKRTMADMRSVGLAWEARAVDTKSYNAAGFTMPAVALNYSDLTTLLSPTYMRNIPQFDGWGHPLQFAIDQPVGGKSAAEYAIRSPGRDGVYSGNTYVGGPTTSFDCDIVYSGGSFIVWPEGVQATK